MYTYVNTAITNVSRCFVCRRNDRRRRIIDQQSIARVYLARKILIPKRSFCCYSHFDINTGLLLYQEYDRIPTVRKLQNINIVNAIRSITKYCIHRSIFDKFKEIGKITDEECIEITGWDRNTFIRFSSFIQNKTLKSNQKRTKYQLLAIYVYWLRKGFMSDCCISCISCSNKN